MQRTDLAHGLAHAMRSALARAELAAGQIERDAATPRARRLAGSVSGAVAELDRLVSDVVALLANERRAPRAEDLRVVVAELRQRHEPALAARGIAWADDPCALVSLHGDSALARRAGVLLLRVGASCVRGGGALALALDGGDGAWSLTLRVTARECTGVPAAESLAELRALASRAHGVFEHAMENGACVLRLRFPIEAGACRAS